MLHALKQLDRLLRGEATRMEALRAGTLDYSARQIATVAMVLGMFYGVCMGVFALTGADAGHGALI